MALSLSVTCTFALTTGATLFVTGFVVVVSVVVVVVGFVLTGSTPAFFELMQPMIILRVTSARVRMAVVARIGASCCFMDALLVTRLFYFFPAIDFLSLFGSFEPSKSQVRWIGCSVRVKFSMCFV